jgi:hypothetical protein
MGLESSNIRAIDELIPEEVTEGYCSFLKGGGGGGVTMFENEKSLKHI